MTGPVSVRRYHRVYLGHPARAAAARLLGVDDDGNPIVDVDDADDWPAPECEYPEPQR